MKMNIDFKSTWLKSMRLFQDLPLFFAMRVLIIIFFFSIWIDRARAENFPQSPCRLETGSYTFFHPGATKLTQANTYETKLTIQSEKHFILESDWGIDWIHEINLETNFHNYKRSALPDWMWNEDSCDRYPIICALSVQEHILPVLRHIAETSYGENDLVPSYFSDESANQAKREKAAQALCVHEILYTQVAAWEKVHQEKLKNADYSK